MSDDRLSTQASSDDDKLYIDEHGVPLLFDVVVPGDVATARGVTLQPSGAQQQSITGQVDLELRIRAAIDAALPKVTEQTAAAMREALEKEVRASLSVPREQTAPDDRGPNERQE